MVQSCLLDESKRHLHDPDRHVGFKAEDDTKEKVKLDWVHTCCLTVVVVGATEAGTAEIEGEAQGEVARAPEVVAADPDLIAVVPIWQQWLTLS